MKKIFCFAFILLISAAAFAEEFSLFRWTSTQKDITKFCNKKGWDEIENPLEGFDSIGYKIPYELYYHGQLVDKIYFAFNQNGAVIFQGITFAKFFGNTEGFVAILDLMFQDKGELLSYNTTVDNYAHFTYHTQLKSFTYADYLLYGYDDSLMITIDYRSY